MKYLLLLLDGAADMEYEALQEQTPLAYAHTPTLDEWCAKGQLGRAQTIPKKRIPGTETAMETLLTDGETSFGRAAMEAYADGVKIADACVYRLNFLGIQDYRIVHYFTCQTDENVQDQIMQALCADAVCQQYLKQMNASIERGKSGQYYVLARGYAPKSTSPFLLMEKAYYTCWPDTWAKWGTFVALWLDDHPLNAQRRNENKQGFDLLWPWAEGKKTNDIPSLYARYGKKGACVAATPFLKGMADRVGMDVLAVHGATGGMDTNIAAKACAAVNAWNTHDFVLVHLEAPDACSHNQDIMGKVKSIEMGDALLKGILDQSDEEIRLLVMTDHYTFCKNGRHGAEPVPYFIASTGINETHSDMRFCEEDAQSMGMIMGDQLLNTLFFK